MKLNVELSPIETNINRDNLKFFTIKNNTKMFNILSDGLYSDKISAIIRELSCNAWDSHVAARKSDIPFHIHLPTELDPEFRIRDYGVGLSKEDVHNIFTVYGESTKTESQDFTGALGLGSKSPFSYVESYTITSWFNSKKNVYSALRDEQGLPAIMHVHEEDTTEDNGVEISFPVYTRDFQSFKNKASEVLRLFPVKPKITGSSIFFQEFSPLLEGSNWKIYQGSNLHQAYAIMANVRYPIIFSSLKTQDPIIVALCALPIEIVFENGELDFAASREQLSYTNFTINAILKKFDNIKIEIAKYFEDEFKSCKTLWEAKSLYHDYFGSYSSKYNRVLNKFIVDSKIEISWNNENITDTKIAAPFKSVENIGVIYAVPRVRAKKPIKCSYFTTGKDNKRIEKAKDTGVLDIIKTMGPNGYEYSLCSIIARAQKDTRISIAYSVPGVLNAINNLQHLQEFKNTSILCLIDKKDDIKKAAKKLSKLFGDAVIQDLSKEVEKFRKEFKAITKTASVKCHGFILDYPEKYVRYSPEYRERSWIKEEIDTSQKFGFVEIERFAPVTFNAREFSIAAAYLSILCNEFKDIKNVKLYGIRKPEIKRLSKTSKLLSYNQAIALVLNDFIAKHPGEVEKFMLMDEFAKIYPTYSAMYFTLASIKNELKAQLKPKHPILTVLEYNEWFETIGKDKIVSKSVAFNELVRISNYKITNVKNTINNLKNVLNDVKMKYNILHLIDFNCKEFHSQGGAQSIIDYIKHADK